MRLLHKTPRTRTMVLSFSYHFLSRLPHHPSAPACRQVAASVAPARRGLLLLHPSTASAHSVAPAQRGFWLLRRSQTPSSCAPTGNALSFLHLCCTWINHINDIILICFTNSLCLLNRDVRFKDIENFHVHSSWNITAKVVSAQIKQTRSGNIVYRAVLTDLSVSKHFDAN